MISLRTSLLSPNMIVSSVEIRAYPLLFTFSAWSTLFFVVLLTTEDHAQRSKAYWLLAASIVGACYTHFFGVVLAGAIYASLIIEHLVTRRSLKPLVISIAVSLVACAGLVPFIAHAVALSGNGTLETLSGSSGVLDTVKDTIRLAFRLVAHSSFVVYPAVFGLFTIGIGGLLLFAIRHMFASLGKDKHFLAALILPVVFAFIALPVISLASSGFTVLAPSYNIWLVPLIAAILAAAFQTSFNQRILNGLAVIALGGQLIAFAVLVLNAEYFTHGPGEWIAKSVDQPETTVIAHDARGTWAMAYYPVAYFSNDRTTQILVHPTEPPRLLTSQGIVAIDDLDAVLAGNKTIHFVSVASNGASETTQFVSEGSVCGGLANIAWAGAVNDTTEQRYCGIASATMIIGDVAGFDFTR
jgi:hypothetical protein